MLLQAWRGPLVSSWVDNRGWWHCAVVVDTRMRRVMAEHGACLIIVGGGADTDQGCGNGATSCHLLSDDAFHQMSDAFH